MTMPTISQAAGVSGQVTNRFDGLPPLPMGWRWATFATLCDRVSVGHVGPTTEFFCDRSVGVPLIRSQDVRPGRLHYETAASVTPSFHAKLKKSQLRAGDILFVRVGANRGDCCAVPSGIGELNCANIVFARPSIPSGFYGHFFRSQFGQNQLLAATTGSAQGVINTGSVANMPVPVPPLPLQRRIASILSAYDDLIENNRKRIAILDEMARRLYREWFVHFRYPDHESVPLVDSPLGLIPQGWSATCLGSMCVNFDRKRRPLSGIERQSRPGPYRYYGAAKPMDAINAFIFDGEYLLLAEDGSVITEDRRPVLQLVNERFWPNNHTHVLQGKAPASTHFLFLALNCIDISPYITGAAQPKITQENMNRIPLVSANQSVHDKFDTMVDPMIQLIQNLGNQINILRRTRDILLPRLMSGRLSVTAAEAAVP